MGGGGGGRSWRGPVQRCIKTTICVFWQSGMTVGRLLVTPETKSTWAGRTNSTRNGAAGCSCLYLAAPVQCPTNGSLSTFTTFYHRMYLPYQSTSLSRPTVYLLVADHDVQPRKEIVARRARVPGPGRPLRNGHSVSEMKSSFGWPTIEIEDPAFEAIGAIGAIGGRRDPEGIWRLGYTARSARVAAGLRRSSSRGAGFFLLLSLKCRRGEPALDDWLPGPCWRRDIKAGRERTTANKSSRDG